MHFTKKVEYHLEVEHQPGVWQDDMSFTTQDLMIAGGAYRRLGDKYGKERVKITMETTYTRKKFISERKLERLMIRA